MSDKDSSGSYYGSSSSFDDAGGSKGSSGSLVTHPARVREGAASPASSKEGEASPARSRESEGSPRSREGDRVGPRSSRDGTGTPESFREPTLATDIDSQGAAPEMEQAKIRALILSKDDKAMAKWIELAYPYLLNHIELTATLARLLNEKMQTRFYKRNTSMKLFLKGIHSLIERRSETMPVTDIDEGMLRGITDPTIHRKVVFHCQRVTEKMHALSRELEAEKAVAAETDIMLSNLMEEIEALKRDLAKPDQRRTLTTFSPEEEIELMKMKRDLFYSVNKTSEMILTLDLQRQRNLILLNDLRTKHAEAIQSQWEILRELEAMDASADASFVVEEIEGKKQQVGELVRLNQSLTEDISVLSESAEFRMEEIASLRSQLKELNIMVADLNAEIDLNQYMGERLIKQYSRIREVIPEEDGVYSPTPGPSSRPDPVFSPRAVRSPSPQRAAFEGQPRAPARWTPEPESSFSLSGDISGSPVSSAGEIPIRPQRVTFEGQPRAPARWEPDPESSFSLSGDTSGSAASSAGGILVHPQRQPGPAAGVARAPSPLLTGRPRDRIASASFPGSRRFYGARPHPDVTYPPAGGTFYPGTSQAPAGRTHVESRFHFVKRLNARTFRPGGPQTPIFESVPAETSIVDITPPQVSQSPSPSLNKTLLLTSPNRKDPLLANISLNPKLLKATADGEHFVCDVSMSLQDQSAADRTFDMPAAGRTVSMPAAADRTFGMPSAADRTFGMPAAADRTFGMPATADRTFGMPAAADRTFGMPAAADRTFDMPVADGSFDVSAGDRTYDAPGIPSFFRPRVQEMRPDTPETGSRFTQFEQSTPKGSTAGDAEWDTSVIFPYLKRYGPHGTLGYTSMKSYETSMANESDIQREAGRNLLPDHITPFSFAERADGGLWKELPYFDSSISVRSPSPYQSEGSSAGFYDASYLHRTGSSSDRSSDRGPSTEQPYVSPIIKVRTPTPYTSSEYDSSLMGGTLSSPRPISRHSVRPSDYDSSLDRSCTLPPMSPFPDDDTRPYSGSELASPAGRISPEGLWKELPYFDSSISVRSPSPYQSEGSSGGFYDASYLHRTCSSSDRSPDRGPSAEQSYVSPIIKVRAPSPYTSSEYDSSYEGTLYGIPASRGPRPPLTRQERVVSPAASDWSELPFYGASNVRTPSPYVSPVIRPFRSTPSFSGYYSSFDEDEFDRIDRARNISPAYPPARMYVEPPRIRPQYASPQPGPSGIPQQYPQYDSPSPIIKPPPYYFKGIPVTRTRRGAPPPMTPTVRRLDRLDTPPGVFKTSHWNARRLFEAPGSPTRTYVSDRSMSWERPGTGQDGSYRSPVRAIFPDRLFQPPLSAAGGSPGRISGASSSPPSFAGSGRSTPRPDTPYPSFVGVGQGTPRPDTPYPSFAGFGRSTPIPGSPHPSFAGVRQSTPIPGSPYPSFAGSGQSTPRPDTPYPSYIGTPPSYGGSPYSMDGTFDQTLVPQYGSFDETPTFTLNGIPYSFGESGTGLGTTPPPGYDELYSSTPPPTYLSAQNLIEREAARRTPPPPYSSPYPMDSSYDDTQSTVIYRSPSPRPRYY